ncbi:hypothetical protein DPMN_053862 [Dreissena polymorpha]|uniref:Uncharacterized protein n=1 Tax=Dreissena polymorpha TaxID=45954 RepID=A0A9D4HR32_DREPO|nr:hypothetical protein DPMN_053862 [Dreissena polymorpha]
MEDEDSNDSIQCHSWSKKEIDILLELVIKNKKLLEGKQGPLVTEVNKRKKVAGYCGSHKKRVWSYVEDSRHMYKQEMCLSETQCSLLRNFEAIFLSFDLER